MRIAVLRERIVGERRVAVTPESATQLVAAGLEIAVERGAGKAAGYSDESYTAAGAALVDSVDLASADLVMPKNMDMAFQARMDGVSMRFVRGFDVTNDNFISRLDVLIGIKVVRPNWGTVIYG